MLALALLLAWSPPAVAAPPESFGEVAAAADVTVRVVDPTGAPIAHAHAALVGEAGRIDGAPAADGLRFDGVPPGEWWLQVAAPGFAPATVAVVVGGAAIARDVVLHPAHDSPLVVEVTATSEAQELEASAQAVHVVELGQARTQSADLGEVMAREQGVSVRRSGGLGSETRFSLNGLIDDQVRFFLDDLPLGLAGFPYGMSTVPLDTVERVEVYRGVVPVRFGADALGGAVNLVTTGQAPGLSAGASTQVGAFGTYRLAGHVGHAAPRRGWRARVAGYLDTSQNRYPIDVEVPDLQGRLTPARVRRTHDAYRAVGGWGEVGAIDQPWADALSLRLFGADLYREIQHNVTMTEPYGEPEETARTLGATLLYAHAPSARVRVRVAGGYTFDRSAFVDQGACVYDWFGECGYPRTRPGELSTGGSDLTLWDHAVVGRAHVDWDVAREQALSLSVAPTWFRRTGVDHLNAPGTRDPQSARREALQLVSGLEHRLTAWGGRVEQVGFVKGYLHVLDSEEALTADRFRVERRVRLRGGLGDGVRIQLTPGVRLKASYEWATRLPTPTEQFGDGVRTLSNLELVPETSHNVNLGVGLGIEDTDAGDLAAAVDGFVRLPRDLILRLGTDTFYTHHNVYGARAVGVETEARWVSAGDHVTVDVNATFLDFRNTATTGTFQDFAGDRIPNRPWLFGNANVQVGASGVLLDGDRLTLDGYSRYVHGYYRAWESVGLEEYKQVIPAQLAHSAALTWALWAGSTRATASVEVDNLTNADLYDFFGVQRPGRSWSVRLTATR